MVAHSVILWPVSICGTPVKPQESQGSTLSLVYVDQSDGENMIVSCLEEYQELELCNCNDSWLCDSNYLRKKAELVGDRRR